MDTVAEAVTNKRTKNDAHLAYDEQGCALIGKDMELRCDFAHMISRLAPDRLARELLVRAAKVKGVEKPVAIDATAGFGEDAFLLAAAGFKVFMYERDPMIAALLRDGLVRGAKDERLAQVVSRMTLVEEDSIVALNFHAQSAATASLDIANPDVSSPATFGLGASNLGGINSSVVSLGISNLSAHNPATLKPDVIYLDPMFPARTKSAAVKKKFQLLHELASPCTQDEASELLSAAIAAAPRKVVVKRPVHGEYLAGIKPSYTIAGKSIRYDCIIPANCKR